MARVFNSKGIVKSATSHEGESDPIITPQMNSLFRNVHPEILKASMQLVIENSLESSEQSLTEEQKKLLAEEQKKLLEGSSNIANERKIIKEQKKRRKFSAGKIQYNADGSFNFENSSYDSEDPEEDIGDIENPGSDFESQGHTIWDDWDDNQTTDLPPTNTIFVDPTYVPDTVSTNKAYQVKEVKDCDQCRGVIDSTLNKIQKEKYKKLFGITGKCRCNDTGEVCNQCSNNLVIGQVCPSCRVVGTALPGTDTPLGFIGTQPLPNVSWNTTDFAYTDEMLTRQAPTSNISAADTRVSDNSARAQAAFGNLLWDDPTYEQNETEQDFPSESPEEKPNPNVKEHDSPMGRADLGWTDTASPGNPMMEKIQTITRPAKEKHKETCICGGTGRIDRVDSNQARALIKDIKLKNAKKLVEINSEENSIERSRKLEELYANIYACPHNEPNNSVQKDIVPPKLEYTPDDDDDDDEDDDEDMDEE